MIHSNVLCIDCFSSLLINKLLRIHRDWPDGVVDITPDLYRHVSKAIGNLFTSFFQSLQGFLDSRNFCL